MALTKKQRERVQSLAKRRVHDHEQVSLYRETSMSGKSETLRYRRRWVERTDRGDRLRSESGMVLSVPISVLEDGRDDPASWEDYNQRCTEAEALFHAAANS